MTKIEITEVFVQAKDGVPIDEAFFKAWDGFCKRGVSCKLVETAQLEDGSVPLSRSTLVAGAIRVVESALNSLGVNLPPADNLPECLTEYRGRSVRKTTWGRLRAETQSNGIPNPLFVKPFRQNKGFPSIAVFSSDDISGHPLNDDDEVLVAEYVVFLTEWRCFVCNGEILQLSHYQGDPLCFPDPDVIRNAIKDFGDRAPAGYGIDFGVLVGGRTVLVEVNEGYSLGSYGLNSGIR
jgi:hypothetical protein